eukprot:1472526-Prymnesium_polylepis.1
MPLSWSTTFALPPSFRGWLSRRALACCTEAPPAQAFQAKWTSTAVTESSPHRRTATAPASRPRRADRRRGQARGRCTTALQSESMQGFAGEMSRRSAPPA